MTTLVGTTDRILRASLGVEMLATAALKICAIHTALGLKTCKEC